jgi:hypothetical protein
LRIRRARIDVNISNRILKFNQLSTQSFALSCSSCVACVRISLAEIKELCRKMPPTFLVPQTFTRICGIIARASCIVVARSLNFLLHKHSLRKGSICYRRYKQNKALQTESSYRFCENYSPIMVRYSQYVFAYRDTTLWRDRYQFFFAQYKNIHVL